MKCVTAEKIRLSEILWKFVSTEDTCQSKCGQIQRVYLDTGTAHDSNVPPPELEFDTLEAEVLCRVHELQETCDQGQKT